MTWDTDTEAHLRGSDVPGLKWSLEFFKVPQVILMCSNVENH